MDEDVSQLTVTVHYGGPFEVASTRIRQTCISSVATIRCCVVWATAFIVEGEYMLLSEEQEQLATKKHFG
jgi:hypothetical protein